MALTALSVLRRGEIGREDIGRKDYDVRLPAAG